MDNFQNVSLTDNIKDSLSRLLNRDLTTLTLSSGTVFPQDLSTDMIGRVVNRTDLKAIYVLDSIEPVTWNLVLDYSSKVPSADEIAKTYQPLNSNLTALSKVTAETNKIPYFVKEGEMSTINLTAFSKNLLESQNANSVISNLGLGSLAKKNTIDGSVDILNSSVTENKLSFTPIKSGEGFTTGDIKETYSYSTESGWINMSGTIGKSGSGATYANDNCKNLFLMMWTLSNVTVQPSKGGSAQSDWDSGKKLVLPTKASLSGSANVRIKL